MFSGIEFLITEVTSSQILGIKPLTAILNVSSMFESFEQRDMASHLGGVLAV